MRKSHKKTGYVFSAISAFGIVPFIVSCFFIIGLLFDFTNTIREVAYQDVKLISKIFTAIIVIILELLSFKISLLTDECEEMEAEINKIKANCDRIIAENELECDRKLKEKDKIVRKLDLLLKTKTPFKECAQLFADMHTYLYKQSEYYLMHKDRPAKKSADEVKRIRKIMNNEITSCKEIHYKHEYLLHTFPELEIYLNDETALLSLNDSCNYEDFKETRDRVIDYLSPEEWNKLSVDDRNQLALDRYKKRNKSNWELGIEYELYIGYLLREGKKPFFEKYHVSQVGELQGLSDLGRDIIAEKINSSGEKTIYIIQCKRWSDKKFIHENTICQLFGTTMEYKIRHRHLNNCKFVAVLISTTELSDMAREFAKYLEVMVFIIPMGEYPMIKCNINGGDKIYHLPFDQQYHRTVIKNEGEFYAYTVEEATKNGFRRAMRHFQ